ncbi:MAG: hypothetical protein HY574_03650 [candidate division NC10 bacterium]|nr:hypothetical protein [candidate division NC10 bacterium]
MNDRVALVPPARYLLLSHDDGVHDAIGAVRVELGREQPAWKRNARRPDVKCGDSPNGVRAKSSPNPILGRQTRMLGPRPFQLVEEDDISVSIGMEEDLGTADGAGGRVGEAFAEV